MAFVVAFDLDDTLYKEVEFVKSGYAAIAKWLSQFGIDSEESYTVMWQSFCRKENPMDAIIQRYPSDYYSIADIIGIYRFHKPRIVLPDDSRQMLECLTRQGCELAVITDGRFVTQRNKIEALGIDRYVASENIIISEEAGCDKTQPGGFLSLQNRYPDSRFFYVGDNPAKDFLWPNKLGWITICVVDNGQNVHPQNHPLSDQHAAYSTVSSVGCIDIDVLRNLLLAKQTD